MIGRIGNRLIASLAPKEHPYRVQDSDLKRFFLRVQPSGVMIYGCDVDLPDGRRSTRTIGRHGVFTPIQAREEAKKILGDIAKGIDPLIARRAPEEATLRQFLDNTYAPWLVSSKKNGDADWNAKAEARANANLAIIHTSFADLLERKIKTITAWNLERWKATALDSGAKPSSINRKLDALRAALSKAVKWGVLEKNPCRDVSWLKLDNCPIVRFLSDEEETRLELAMTARDDLIRKQRQSANHWRSDRNLPTLPDLSSKMFVDHVTPMVRLARYLGLRRGEIFHLKVPQVDLQNRVVTVLAETAKSGKTRHIPLNKIAFNTVCAWINERGINSGFLFPSEGGAPFNNINKAWRGLTARANIPNLRFHDLRHDFASRLVMRGVDLNTVRELLGHSDLTMTLRYAHLAPRLKADAVSLLERAEVVQIDSATVHKRSS